MVSRARARRRAELVGLDRLNIFVPAIMGVGLLFWLASEVRELVRTSGDASRAKRAGIDGHAVARWTLGRDEVESAERIGLRPRPVYLLTALTLGGGGLYVAIGSLANYLRPGGYVAHIAWLLALALVVSLVAVIYATVAMVVFVRYPSPPNAMHQVLAHSLLTTRSTAGGQWTGGPSWRLSAGVMASGAAAGLLSLVVAAAPHVVNGGDRRLSDWFHGLALPWWTQPTDLMFRTETVLALVVLVGLASARCRALAVAYACATGFGLLASVVLRGLVERPRPPDGPLAGWADSFPSGHVIQSVIIVGLVPLAVATLVHRRRVVAALTLGLGLAAVGSAVNRVADGLHWPTDVLGGALIGLTLALGARWVVASPRAHLACHGCLWSPNHEKRLGHRGFIPLGVSAASAVRLLAHLSAAAVAVALAVLTVTVGVPTSSEGYVFGAGVERPVQLALAGMVSVGALLAWRWEAVGAVLIAFAATCLGIFAAIEYQPLYAVALTAVAMVPAVLLWLSWQHRRSAMQMVVLATVTMVLLGSTWAGASRVYDIYFGATHPDSAAAALAVDRVEWVWSGALRADSVTVTARLAQDHERASLLVESADGAVTATSVEAAPDGHRVVRLQVEGLQPATDYTYTVVVDGQGDTARGVGRFQTPEVGAFSFTVTAGSCARVGSNGAVFDALAAERGLFHLALGDLHYGNIESTQTGPFLQAYDRVLTQPGQAAFYRGSPVAYVWDDHDYGPNDAGASSPSRDASREVFAQVVPHYPYASPGGTINQAFTIGRVRFVLTDSRSEQTDTTLLGQEQLEWLTGELVAASRSHALVVWANPLPWIGEARDGADGWAGHSQERRHIADALAQAGVRNLVMVSGDAHMVAIDDGSNSDYSTVGGAGFPVLHAAALDRPGGVKGGPYSEGTFPGGGQYGVIDIDDDGGSVTVTLTGRRWDGSELVRYTHTVPPRG